MRDPENPIRAIVVSVALVAHCLSASSHAEEIDNSSARAFNAAAALQNAGLHKRALTKWQAFIAKFPNNERIGRAHYYLGVCHLREKNYDEAAKTFENIIAKWPDLPQADKAHFNLAMSRYELASQANNRDALLAAASLFEQIPSKYPQSELVPEAIYYQGDCRLTAGELPKAVAAFEKLIKEHGSSPRAARAHYDLGITQQELNKPADAIKTYRSFLKNPKHASHPLAPELRLRLAICLFDTNQLDPAVAEFDAVSKLNDYELADYAALRLGQTKLEQKKYEEAARQLDEFSKKNRESAYRDAAIKTAGQCYFLAGKPDQAVRILPPVAGGKDPVAPEAAYWLAKSQLKLNRAPQALGTLDKALARFGNDPFATNLRFERIESMYAMPDRRDQTPPLYEAFWRENHKHNLASQAGYMAAFSSFGLGQFQKAMELSEQYLSAQDVSPDDELVADVKFIAGESYLMLSPEDAGQRQKAEQHFRSLIQKHPDHPRAAQCHLRIGWCLQASEKYAESANYLRGQLPKFDKAQQLPEAQLLIGQCHAKLNQHQQAVAAFNASLAANQDWSEADEVLIEAAESYRALNELDEARVQLERLVNSKPKSARRPRALFLLGDMARTQKRLDQAIGWYRQVADAHADSDFGGPAIHGLSALYLTKGQYGDTRQWASRLIDGNYSDEMKQRGRFARGIAASREKDFEKAAGDLTAYLARPVDDKEAIAAKYAMALCRIEQKNFDDARKLLNELVASQPEFANADKAFYELGHGLLGDKSKSQQAAEAFAWIATNRSESPLASEAWFRVAQSHVERAKSDENGKDAALNEAEQALQKGLTKVDDEGLDEGLDEGMLYLLGNVQNQRKRFIEAADTLMSYLQKYPNGQFAGAAMFLAAQSRYALNQYDQALPLFARVSSANFGDAPAEQVASYRSQALFRAGECAAKLAKWPESQAHFQSLIDQHADFPQRSEARYGVAFAFQQQNQLDQATRVYEQVTTETETETAAKARFMVGEIEFGRKKYEDAIEQFLIVSVGYPYEAWQALARFETARCFVELGDKARATKTLRELIEKHPDHTRVPDAKKMLEQLEQ